MLVNNLNERLCQTIEGYRRDQVNIDISLIENEINTLKELLLDK